MALSEIYIFKGFTVKEVKKIVIQLYPIPVYKNFFKEKKNIPQEENLLKDLNEIMNKSVGFSIPFVHINSIYCFDSEEGLIVPAEDLNRGLIIALSYLKDNFKKEESSLSLSNLLIQLINLTEKGYSLAFDYDSPWKDDLYD